jgi:plasmid replication initiation protein
MNNSNKNELVVKSNRLIEASYRLTLVEQRIILLAITDARRTETGLSEANLLEIRAADYAEMFNVPENHAYEQLKEAGQTLFLRYVVLYDINPKTGKEDKITVRWISSVRYADGTGIIYLRFAHDMVPYITRLQTEFTSYRLEKVANMSSAYAIRLYELLIQWGSVGKREIELAWIKKTLLVGNHYTSIKDFKKWVIDVAMYQINEFSDMTVSYTQRKTGRVVTHLIFSFKPKEEPKLNKPEEKAVKQKTAAPPEVLDEGRAKMKALVIEFLSGNNAYKRLYPHIPVDQAWHVEGIRNEFMTEFNEWRQGL